MICDILVIVAVVAIPLLGSSSYSSVSALPSFSTIDHHKTAAVAVVILVVVACLKVRVMTMATETAAVVIITVGLEEAAAMINLLVICMILLVLLIAVAAVAVVLHGQRVHITQSVNVMEMTIVMIEAQMMLAI